LPLFAAVPSAVTPAGTRREERKPDTAKPPSASAEARVASVALFPSEYCERARGCALLQGAVVTSVPACGGTPWTEHGLFAIYLWIYRGFRPVATQPF
jgi:hypothetical protein